MNLRQKFNELGTRINSTKLCMFFQSIKMNITMSECILIVKHYGTDNKIKFEELKILLNAAKNK